MTKVCICQICTCGRHRCPHHPNVTIPKGDKSCFLSEYNNRFHNHPIEPTKSFKPPQQAIKSDAPLEDKTTNRNDYIKHPLEKPNLHKAEEYRKPDGNFDHLTSYHKDYPKKAAPRTTLIKREPARRSPGKFDGEPTYKLDYRKWPMSQREKIKQGEDYRPMSAPFEGASNYKTDYMGHRATPTKSLRPADRAVQSDQPFDGTTGYKQEYIKHPLQPRFQREMPQYEPNKVPLDGLSTNKRDYTLKAGEMRKSMKPEQGAYISDAPFKDHTTNRADYVKWPSTQPYVRTQEVYQRPEGETDYNTTHQTTFTQKPVAVTKPFRPQNRKSAPGKFEGNTHYGTDYRKWDLPEKAMKHIDEYVPPSAPFEGQSGYRDDYKGHRGAPRSSMKPMEGAKMSDQPFDGRTGYKDDFIKHPMEARQKREQPQWQANTAPLEGLSTYKKDFFEKAPQKLNSFKPEQGAYQSDAPFQGNTTQKTDFVKWPGGRPYVRPQEVYVRPEGDVDFNTTHNTQYTLKRGERTQAIKPIPRKGDPGKFQGLTNYEQDFRKWAMPEREKLTQRADYVPPDAPFEGASHYRTDFIKKDGGPRSSMRPVEKGIGSNAPFEGHTMYRSDYTEKNVGPCPATILDREGYTFTEQDMTGHKWYHRSGGPTLENRLLTVA